MCKGVSISVSVTPITAVSVDTGHCSGHWTHRTSGHWTLLAWGHRSSGQWTLQWTLDTAGLDTQNLGLDTACLGAQDTTVDTSHSSA